MSHINANISSFAETKYDQVLKRNNLLARENGALKEVVRRYENELKELNMFKAKAEPEKVYSLL